MSSDNGISAEMVKDSVSPAGVRLTTMKVTMHRFVLAELNTHRVFSRNSASSRAIPVEKQLQTYGANPAYPRVWPCEQPGMQGGSELTGVDLEDARTLFDDVNWATFNLVKSYLEDHPNKATRLHKSVINRLLEPMLWHTVVITSSEWANFWGLRLSPKAQPEFRLAAEAMKYVYDNSVPIGIGPTGWHLPFITHEEANLSTSQKQIVSVARCARASSLHAGDAKDFSLDAKLFDLLTSDDPPHSSPLEHVAQPDLGPGMFHMGNFTGWNQLRHMTSEIADLRDLARSSYE